MALVVASKLARLGQNGNEQRPVVGEEIKTRRTNTYVVTATPMPGQLSFFIFLQEPFEPEVVVHAKDYIRRLGWRQVVRGRVRPNELGGAQEPRARTVNIAEGWELGI